MRPVTLRASCKYAPLFGRSRLRGPTRLLALVQHSVTPYTSLHAYFLFFALFSSSGPFILSIELHTYFNMPVLGGPLGNIAINDQNRSNSSQSSRQARQRKGDRAKLYGL